VVSEAEFHVYCNASDPLVSFRETLTVAVKVWIEKIPPRGEN
jgi:hypothetical protein